MLRKFQHLFPIGFACPIILQEEIWLYIWLSIKKYSEADNIRLSGSCYSRVYEGNFKETGKWCADFKEKTDAKGLKTEKMHMWYTTCPKCAKKYGKNYVVIIVKTL